MRLATSSGNLAYQERRNIINTLLRAAVPVRFVTAGCKPAKQERHTKSTNVHAERLSLLTIFMRIFCGPHLPKVGT